MSKVTVEVNGAYWAVPAPPDRGLSPLAASDVTTVRTGAEEITLISFTVHSDFASEVNGTSTAIFRDASGRILGGTDRLLYMSDGQYYRAGASQGSLLVSQWYPADADPSRTEVHLARNWGGVTVRAPDPVTSQCSPGS